MTTMAYSEINNGIKQESSTHFHELLHAQLSAEDSRNIDKTDSAEESGESPLDFSIKRKSTSYDEVSGSDSLSSPASSPHDNGGHHEDRKSSDTDGMNNKSGSSQESPPDRSPLFHHKQFKLDHFRQNLSPVHERIGQPRAAEQVLPHMLNELQMGISNANMLANSFPAMAALMDQRRFSGGSKGTRPFKAYPKDSLSVQVETGAPMIPHYLTSFANFENSAIMQGLNLSSEEVFSIYKQQLLALREREKYLENLKISQEQAISRTCTSTTTTSPGSPVSTSVTPMHLPGRNNGLNSNIGGFPIEPPSSRSTPTDFTSDSSNNNSFTQSQSVHSLTAGGRRRPRSLPDEQKDEAYWERRRKNNEAAKRSRDARRAKEDQIAIRAALLEQENLKLRVEVAALKTETAKLRCMLYNS
ncbi:protein giant-like [Ruditapes philippinarum]|uniref:protein giant-like n=1 Tax=Ruditapes philippinarum TaxID=129788 RepID=UPI00295C08AC|nr:protein giant-like [Ruditapes philippinarum]XP_060584964.1 protein giant-like [Ruditapes philippinarum]